MNSNNHVKLSEDHIDDLLYLARTGELSDLQSMVDDLSKATLASPAAILAGAVDDHSGNTVLHMAAANSHDEIISYVLAAIIPSQPKAPDVSVSNPSTEHDPSSQSRLTPLDSSSTTTSAPSLLNHPNSSLSTPLHWAALNGHLSSVRLLVDAGADMTAENAAKHDALDEAERSGRKDVVRLLMARMSGKSEDEIKELESQKDGEDGMKATQQDLERLGLGDDEAGGESGSVDDAS